MCSRVHKGVSRQKRQVRPRSSAVTSYRAGDTSTRQTSRTTLALAVAFRELEGVAFAALPAVVRVQVVAATPDQLF